MKNINRDRIEAHAGAALSFACVALPHLIGERYIGATNADRTIPNSYPLKPLHWKVARTLGSQVKHIVEYPADRDAGARPKDFPTVAITSVHVHGLDQYYSSMKVAEPAVAWIYKDEHVMVSAIPYETLSKLTDLIFRFTLRRGPEPLKVAAGLWYPYERRLQTTPLISPGEIVPIAQIPQDVAAY